MRRRLGTIPGASLPPLPRNNLNTLILICSEGPLKSGSSDIYWPTANSLDPSAPAISIASSIKAHYFYSSSAFTTTPVISLPLLGYLVHLIADTAGVGVGKAHDEGLLKEEEEEEEEEKQQQQLITRILVQEKLCRSRGHCFVVIFHTFG
jgi:hypothetical protein